jgi:single-strand DNA-binding protein
MASVNTVTLIGHLGKDPEAKVHGDRMICSFTLATSERWKSKGGEQQERTDWHNITAFGKLGEICAEYLTKGSLVYIQGSIRYDKYEKDGETKYSTKIIADEMKMLSGKPSGDRPKRSKDEEPATGGGGGGDTDFDDDIPF